MKKLFLLLPIILSFCLVSATPHQKIKITTEPCPIIIQSRPQLKEFESLTELESWIKENKTLYLAPDENGVLTLVNHIPTDKDDCDDQALGFQQKALGAGYVISVHLVENGRIFGVKVTEFTENHMGNLAVIGNDVYYIEPTSGEITFIVTRD